MAIRTLSTSGGNPNHPISGRLESRHQWSESHPRRLLILELCRHSGLTPKINHSQSRYSRSTPPSGSSGSTTISQPMIARGARSALLNLALLYENRWMGGSVFSCLDRQRKSAGRRIVSRKRRYKPPFWPFPSLFEYPYVSRQKSKSCWRQRSKICIGLASLFAFSVRPVKTTTLEAYNHSATCTIAASCPIFVA